MSLSPDSAVVRQPSAADGRRFYRRTGKLLLAAGLAALVAVLAIPESRAAPSPARPSFRPRLRVPRKARGAFAAALPCVIGVWALGGFYLSLGPSLAAQLLRSQNLLWGWLCDRVAVRRRSPHHARGSQPHAVQSHARRVCGVVRRRSDHVRRDRDEDAHTLARRLRGGRTGGDRPSWGPTARLSRWRVPRTAQD